MDCDVITDLMPAYESGVASAKSRQLVEEHLAGCPTCRAAFGAGSPNGEIGDLPTPAQPDERAVLVRIRSGFFSFFNLLVAALLFLGSATLVLLAHLGLNLSYWWPYSPREARLGFPLSALPTVWEMLLLLGILLGLRWVARRYPPDRVPASTSGFYLGAVWLALLGLALLSFFTTGTWMPVFALWLAVALSLEYVRWTPRVALGSIAMLMVVTASVVVFWFVKTFLKIISLIAHSSC